MVEVEEYFYSKKYFNFQKDYFEYALNLVIYKSVRPIGVMSFFSNDSRVWFSPGRGTFGGLFLMESVQLAELYEIYALILDIIKTEGGEVLEITLPPENHNQSINSKHSWMLRSLGAEVISSDLNHFISVDTNSLETKLNHGNKKRLRKCNREGCIFQRCSTDSLTEVYDLLKKNRTSKQNTLSLSEKQLQQILTLFPERIKLFKLVLPSNNEMLSAAVCIRLSTTVLYVFYWGNDPNYSNYSPVVSLACGIYSYCEKKGIKIIDLGVSTLNEEANFGLVQFKDNLGATVSRKERLLLRL
jgi:hypothetical protein